MELVIAEKPSVARDLARVLGVRASRGEWLESERYAITWCIGHLLELEEPAAYDPQWKAWRIDRLPMLPVEFQLRPSAHARRQLRAVTRLLKDRRFTSVVNACDAGREGELIFRYVYQHARSRLPVRRLWISSLTDDAIRRGFAALRPGRDFDPLADAARSRSEADWLVGMNATRAVTVHGRTGGNDMLFSIGRVQTPTLALLVAREHEITSFVPRPYWEVRAELQTADGDRFSATWRAGALVRIAEQPIAEQIVARDRAATDASCGPRVVAVHAKTVREPPPPLFDLTSLQRTANRRFGLSAARTLELAQALYERHKLITYPRTDSRHLSSDLARELPALFGALAAQPAYEPYARALVGTPGPSPTASRRVIDDGKVSDHHAIIPTGTAPRGGLDRDEARLYDLIVRRFLGAFFADAELAVTEAWIRVGAGDGPAPTTTAADRERFVSALPPPPDHFLARGRVRVVAGWQEVAGIDPRSAATYADRSERGPARDAGERDDAGVLPVLVVGQQLSGTFEHVGRETTPPPRYTDATLLAAMEGAGKTLDDEALRAAMKDVGLGTPATRASIIETLLRRRYIARERQSLVPTPTGIGLIRTLGVRSAADTSGGAVGASSGATSSGTSNGATSGAASGATIVASLASAELTGSWEARLARIARGQDSRASFMADIATYVTKFVAAIRGSAPPPALPPVPAAASATPSSRSMPAPARSGAARSAPARATRTRSRAGTQKPARSRSRGGAQPSPPSRDARGTAPVRRMATVASTNGAPPTTASLPCPSCRAGALITGSRGWGCSRWREGCRFVVWFQTAGKRLSPAQLEALVTRGKTRKAMFIDGSGKPVSARLVLDLGAGASGRATFVRVEPS